MRKNKFYLQLDEKSSLKSRLKALRGFIGKLKEEEKATQLAIEEKINSKYKQLDLEEEANKLEQQNK